jgi:hypothetical protein
VKSGEVSDVMSLRKAAKAFTAATVKGYTGSRFCFINRLKQDMLRENGLPESCKVQVCDNLDIWDKAVGEFESHSATDEGWTVEGGVSMTNLLLVKAAELDTAHSAMSQSWESVKKARKVAAALAVKAKNVAVKAKNEAIRPFITNGIDGGWKGILFHLNLVTTGHVHAKECPGYEASKAAVMETTAVIDWSEAQYWNGQEELPADKRGHS